MLRRFVNGLPIGLSILAVAIAIGTLYIESREETVRRIVLEVPPESAPLPDEAVLPITAPELGRLFDEMNDIKDQADSAANSADVILSFIEGASILLAALVAISVLVIGSSIQDIRSQLEESIANAETRFINNEESLANLVSTIQQQVDDSIQQAETRTRTSEERVQNLSARIEDSIKETEGVVAGLHGIVHEAVEGAKQDAENSFRVLSLLLLAEQQVRARNRTTAIATLEEAHKIDPLNQTTNYLLGYLYVGRKEFDTAIQHLKSALQINPNFAPALAAMGLAQRRMGDPMNDEIGRRKLWAEAELNLLKALEADPTLIDADNESYFGTLGGLYRRQGRNEEALKAYEDAVRITPNNSYPVGNLAILYKKLAHQDKAEHMFNRVIEISEAILDDHPGDTWARLDLAQAFLVLGQKQKAVNQYKNVIERLGETGPLESALSGLQFLLDAPQAIPGIEDVMFLLKEGMEQINRRTTKYTL